VRRPKLTGNENPAGGAETSSTEAAGVGGSLAGSVAAGGVAVFPQEARRSTTHETAGNARPRRNNRLEISVINHIPRIRFIRGERLTPIDLTPASLRRKGIGRRRSQKTRGATWSMM